jgi:hypothetical protein
MQKAYNIKVKIKDIKEELVILSDTNYQKFIKKLAPSTKYEVLGVSSPKLKSLSKKVINNADLNIFFDDYEFRYSEDVVLYGLVIFSSKIDYDSMIKRLDYLINYMDCWIHTDLISLPKKYDFRYKEIISHYLDFKDSDSEIKQRIFGIFILRYYMRDTNLVKEGIDLLKTIKANAYYSMMMIAWCLSEALAYNFDEVYYSLDKCEFSSWIVSKTIQKGIESRKINIENKNKLKAIRNNIKKK